MFDQEAAYHEELETYCETCNGPHMCHNCGGEGVTEYEGHPLDDYIDADSTKLVLCSVCHGTGNEERADGDAL